MFFSKIALFEKRSDEFAILRQKKYSNFLKNAVFNKKKLIQ